MADITMRETSNGAFIKYNSQGDWFGVNNVPTIGELFTGLAKGVANNFGAGLEVESRQEAAIMQIGGASSEVVGTVASGMYVGGRFKKSSGVNTSKSTTTITSYYPSNNGALGKWQTATLKKRNIN